MTALVWRSVRAFDETAETPRGSCTPESKPPPPAVMGVMAASAAPAHEHQTWEHGALAQLDDVWRAGAVALLDSGWVCPTELDLADDGDNGGGDSGDDGEQDDNHDDCEPSSFDGAATYVWEGVWTASAGVRELAGEEEEGEQEGGATTEFRVRMGIPWRLAAALRREILRHGGAALPLAPGHLRRHLPNLTAFAGDFFASGGGFAVQVAAGRKRTELRFATAPGSVGLVVEFTPEAADEEGRTGWHFHSWSER